MPVIYYVKKQDNESKVIQLATFDEDVTEQLDNINDKIETLETQSQENNTLASNAKTTAELALDKANSAGSGTVKSVNNVSPDDNGNVSISIPESTTVENSVTSNSITNAGSANAVRLAYDKGNEALTAANNAQTTATNASNTASEALTTANSKWTSVDASTSTKGIVQLNNTVTSTSTSLAATAKSVKTAYDKATEALEKAEGNTTIIESAITLKEINLESIMFYVDSSTGSDDNDGETASTPFKTLDHAMQQLVRFRFSTGGSPVIKLGNGTYSSKILGSSAWNKNGSDFIVIRGNGVDNTLLNPIDSNCFSIGGNLKFEELHLNAPLLVSHNGFVAVGNLIVSATTAQINASTQTGIVVVDMGAVLQHIDGGCTMLIRHTDPNQSALSGIFLRAGGVFFVDGIDTTLSFSLANITTGTITCIHNGTFFAKDTTHITGTIISGQRYYVRTGGQIINQTGDLIPGTAEGAMDAGTYGFYGVG